MRALVSWLQRNRKEEHLLELIAQLLRINWLRVLTSLQLIRGRP